MKRKEFERGVNINDLLFVIHLKYALLGKV
jgi:hypothetical protein